MVHVMVMRSSPERYEIVKGPWKVVSRVRVNNLEQAKNDPGVHGNEVKVLGNNAPQYWGSHGTESKGHNLNRRSIFRSKTEGCRVLVVDFVDILVQRPPVESAVEPIVPGVLEDEEYCDLVGHLGPVRERNARVQTDI
jgi:hypothetical protein